MNPDIIHALEVAAIVVAGTLTGSELAVAVFFHPRISRLEDAVHVRAVQAFAPLKPFYILSGWSEFFMHLRLLAHGFMICLVYFGPPREYFAPKSA